MGTFRSVCSVCARIHDTYLKIAYQEKMGGSGGVGWGWGCSFSYLQDVTVATLLFYKHLLKAWKTQLSTRCVYFML